MIQYFYSNSTILLTLSNSVFLAKFVDTKLRVGNKVNVLTTYLAFTITIALVIISW
jgi:hypothetical protein